MMANQLPASAEHSRVPYAIGTIRRVRNTYTFRITTPNGENMVGRLQLLKNAHTTRLVAPALLVGLITSCGLLEEVKTVPQPADSVVLSNRTQLDAGDGGATIDANRPQTPSDAATANSRPHAEVNTLVTKPTPSVATTPVKPAEFTDPDAGPVNGADGGAGGMPDSGYSSDSSLATHTTDSSVNSGQSSPNCGTPQANGVALCDPVEQCGCGNGENCAYTPGRQRRFTCVDPGETAAQDACDLDDECVRGTVCAQGLCMATCASNGDCSNNSQCVNLVTADGVEPDIRVCAQACDPLDATSCGRGATCAATAGAHPTCIRKRDDGTHEEPCEQDADCEHGFGCTEAGVCRAWCTLEDKLERHVEDAGTQAHAPATECPVHSSCELADNGFGLGQCTAPCPVPNVEGSQCSIVPTSCGCSEGATCHAEPLGKTLCEAPGPNGYMMWCDKSSHCAAGLSCLANLCRPLCDAQTLPCADGSTCAKTLSSEFSPSACLGHCNPVNPGLSSDGFTACGVGAYCSPGFAGDAQSPESVCARGTDLKPRIAGESCQFDTDCTDGLGCDRGTQKCAKWCSTNQDCGKGSCYLSGSVRTRNRDELLGWCR